MSVQEVRAAGHEGLVLATQLLQRARLAGQSSGVWEPADVQWWWRMPRPSDEIDQVFWVDADGPIAGVYLTTWRDSWQCDPILVPDALGPDAGIVWARALEQVSAHVDGKFEVSVRDDDRPSQEIAERFGLVAGDSMSTGTMDIGDRRPVAPPPSGFAVVDRAERGLTPHPMRDRNGEGVAERLRECSLYDPELDLAVEAPDGQIAGYSLYWFDPITKMGLIEPVRVEDDFQRRGIGRAMLTAGLERLASKGAERVTIGYESEAAGDLYRGAGFQLAWTVTTYEGQAASI